jgi:hypothetical protein
MLSVLASILLSIQPPISVKVSNVNNNTPIEKVGDRPVVFGIKETLEEILVDQGYSLDSNGMDVSVSLDEISSPQRVLNIIGLQWLKKDYIVTTQVCIGTGCFKGVAKRQTYVFAAFLNVENNEVPLNKKAFSKALQKSLEDAMTLRNNINNQ